MSRFAVVLAVLLASPAVGAAEVCPRGNEPATGPLAGGIGPADFGAVPEACAATDASLRLRAELGLASTAPDYDRRFIGAATLRGRYQLGERSTVSFAADAFNYHYVSNAGLASHGASVGPGTVAFQRTFAAGAETAASVYARALVPLDSARQNGFETGLEIGGGLRMSLGTRWIVDGGLALAAPTDVVGGQIHARIVSTALAEAWLRLRSWVAVAAGMDLRLQASPDFEVASAIPRVAARFRLPRRFWTAVLVEVPVAGQDRTDLITGLFLGFSAN